MELQHLHTDFFFSFLFCSYISSYSSFLYVCLSHLQYMKDINVLLTRGVSSYPHRDKYPEALYTYWQEPVADVHWSCTVNKAHTNITYQYHELSNPVKWKLCLDSPKGVTVKGVLSFLPRSNSHPVMSSMSLSYLRFKQTVKLLTHPLLTCKYKENGTQALRGKCRG